ncbi:DEAD/DEAH box family ATP-dependent RNA helicase [Neptunitalea chrysea]|uniref:DEAD/DEAH box family ATP-dependent RNA helicase n=1 Tax=Neptunitalea chrysea TaxID=1647581 RepID=A0A9W6EVG0_9FLAO|nr:DEAD/DEAH box helicase [Neptunitalea chrysea]GLB52477.1 DEAD/DEAH box family ATP-dependent RNA helicase [Neptunitalea chrysea]
MNFNELKLSGSILKAISKAGYTTATSIQSEAIPRIIEGRDVLACAQTGTGKTAAFAIPILQQLQQNPSRKKAIRVLVVTPTRELAVQIHKNFNAYSAFLPITSQVIVGGVSQQKQIIGLKKRTDIVIATPGRLLDLVNTKHINLSYIETLVLDEADTMLDMGFINDIKKILSLLPKKKQILFFSATLPKAIRKFALNILYQPEEIVVAPVSSTAHTVEQSVCFTPKQEKREVLVSLLKNNKSSRSLIFTRTKRGADKLVKHLDKTGIKAAAIHGNKSQNARQKALNDFKDSRIAILVATDIASRGIDIAGLPQVINYELPNVPETYVHRIGRTGRAGKPGHAISLCDTDERTYLKTIENLIGFSIPRHQAK